MLSKQLGALDIASWTQPNGGYFVSLDVLPALAQEVVAMAKTAGLVLTPAGATFPYGIDPEDRNVRIAPTFGSLSGTTGCHADIDPVRKILPALATLPRVSAQTRTDMTDTNALTETEDLTATSKHPIGLKTTPYQSR